MLSCRHDHAVPHTRSRQSRASQYVIGPMSHGMVVKPVCAANCRVRCVMLSPRVGCDITPNFPAVGSERLRYIIADEKRATVYSFFCVGRKSGHNNYDTAQKNNTSRTSTPATTHRCVVCKIDDRERSQHAKSSSFRQHQDGAGFSAVD